MFKKFDWKKFYLLTVFTVLPVGAMDDEKNHNNNSLFLNRLNKPKTDKEARDEYKKSLAEEFQAANEAMDLIKKYAEREGEEDINNSEEAEGEEGFNLAGWREAFYETIKNIQEYYKKITDSYEKELESLGNGGSFIKNKSLFLTRMSKNRSNKGNKNDSKAENDSLLNLLEHSLILKDEENTEENGEATKTLLRTTQEQLTNAQKHIEALKNELDLLNEKHNNELASLIGQIESLSKLNNKPETEELGLQTELELKSDAGEDNLKKENDALKQENTELKETNSIQSNRLTKAEQESEKLSNELLEAKETNQKNQKNLQSQIQELRANKKEERQKSDTQKTKQLIKEIGQVLENFFKECTGEKVPERNNKKMLEYLKNLFQIIKTKLTEEKEKTIDELHKELGSLKAKNEQQTKENTNLQASYISQKNTIQELERKTELLKQEFENKESQTRTLQRDHDEKMAELSKTIEACGIQIRGLLEDRAQRNATEAEIEKLKEENQRLKKHTKTTLEPSKEDTRVEKFKRENIDLHREIEAREQQLQDLKIIHENLSKTIESEAKKASQNAIFEDPMNQIWLLKKLERQHHQSFKESLEFYQKAYDLYSGDPSPYAKFEGSDSFIYKKVWDEAWVSTLSTRDSIEKNCTLSNIAEILSNLSKDKNSLEATSDFYFKNTACSSARKKYEDEFHTYKENGAQLIHSIKILLEKIDLMKRILENPKTEEITQLRETLSSETITPEKIQNLVHKVENNREEFKKLEEQLESYKKTNFFVLIKKSKEQKTNKNEIEESLKKQITKCLTEEKYYIERPEKLNKLLKTIENSGIIPSDDMHSIINKVEGIIKLSFFYIEYYKIQIKKCHEDRIALYGETFKAIDQYFAPKIDLCMKTIKCYNDMEIEFLKKIK